MANKTAILSVRIVSDSKRFRTGMKQAESTISKFNKAVGKTSRIAATTTALTTLGAMATASASNVAALTASLSAVAGAALALPGIVGAFAVGLVAMVAALKDAPKVLGDLANKFGSLQDSISTAFWASAEKPIRSLITSTLPALESGLSKVGDSLGKWTGELAASIEKAASNTSLQNLFEKTAESIDIASQGLQPLVDGLKAVGGTGLEYLAPLAQAFTDLSTRFGAWAQQAAEDGSLKRWTEQGITALQNLGGILLGLGGILSAIGTAAQSAGGAGIAELASGLQRVADVMNAEPFQGALTTVFEGAHTAMGTLGTVLAPLGDLFVALAPVIAQVMTTAAELSAAVVSGLAPGLSGLTPLISSVVSLFGSLAPIISVVLGIVSQLAIWIGQNSTLFMTLASAVLGAMAAISAIRAVMTAYNAVMILVKGTQLAVTTAMTAYRAGLTASTAIQAGFNAVMAANPMTLVIIAVLALVAGIIYLATQTQFFQTIWAAMTSFVQTAIAVATAFIVAAWQKVSSFFTGMVAGIRGAWVGFTTAVQTLIAAAIAVVRSTIETVKSTVDSVISGARSLFESGFNFMRSVAEGAINGVIGLINNISGAVQGAISWVRDLFSFEMPGWMSSVFGGGMTGSDFTGTMSLLPAGDFGTGVTGGGFALGALTSGSNRTEIHNTNVTIEFSGVVTDRVGTAREIKRLLTEHDALTGGA
ncbi:hypothetical protein ACIOTN_17315 [Glutamicibacter sp. NPDC087661]|uniref:phage tail protein n=1 Tax=Glutamicibacter sp. NPDC087661 TaxID=3363996 RepID=UPI0037F596CF